MLRRLRMVAPGLLVSVCLVVLAPACVTVTADTVRDHVARFETCPPTSLDVRAREEIDPMSYRDSMMYPPSAEIAAEPTRLDYWRQQQAKLWADLLGGATVFEVSGCGFRGLTACKPSSRHISCHWLSTDAAIASGQLHLGGSELRPPSERHR